MRKVLAIAACLLGAAALTACTTVDGTTGETVKSNTKTGALTGALAGAALGYLTNTNNSDQGRKNALIGAGLGALAGTAVGNYMDKQQAELRRELAGTGVNVDRQGDNIVLQMPGDVTFDTNRSEIKPQFYTVLNDVAGTLNKYPQTTVDVIGHADSTGSAALNQGLSERRAGSVAEYLVTAGGVMRERLAVAGKGSTAPIADNATPDGRAKNRRVEIVLKPITS